MKISGVISEYNPYHSGHDYHLNKTREVTGCDYVVCLMSGGFTQRGEPAIFDKWTRAKAAVACGADLVLELPVLYALRSAEGFADGAIRILHGLNTDNFSFGSETDDITALSRIAHALHHEPKAYRSYLKENLSRGLSYPSTREQALSRYFDDDQVSELLTGSNAILGIEYLKANLKLKRNALNPYLVKRKGDGYHDDHLSASLSSATAIRKAIFDTGLNDNIAHNMPSQAFNVVANHIKEGFTPVHSDMFFNQIIYMIRKLSAEEIALYPDVTEGLENRIKKTANDAANYVDLVAKIKSKRFTQTRIQRILCYLLLGITKNDIAYADKHTPDAVKVLAYKKSADPLISHLSKYARIGLFHASTGRDKNPFTKIDIRASDIYALTQSIPLNATGQDFTTKTPSV